MAPLTFKKLSFAGLLLLAVMTRGSAQYQLSGGVNVIAGVSVGPYTISGGTTSTADKWCASTGTINSTSNSCINNTGTPNVSVTWSASGTLSYYLNGTGSPVATLAVTAYTVTNNIELNPNQEFAPDEFPFVPLNQLYTLNLQGSQVLVPPGTVTYSWQESLDGTHYSPLLFGNTQNFTFSQAFTQATTWIVRVVNVNLNGDNYTYTSTPIMVQAVSPIVIQTVTPSSELSVSGADPGAITASAATGGTMCGGTYTYLWQTSTDNINWTNTSSTGLTFDPGDIYLTTYARLQATCGPIVGFSPTVPLNTNPALQGGLISPINITIASGTSPGNLTGSPATLGDAAATECVYTWWSSPNGNAWTEISGPVETQNYNPGNLTATTWYMRKVSCSGQGAQSNAVVVNVGTPSGPGNSIITRVVTAGGVTSFNSSESLTALSDVKQTTQFFDEIGRLYQTVAKQGSLVTSSSANFDLITPVAYDATGREVFKYLPYTSAYSTGVCDLNPLPDQNGFNAGLFQTQGDNFYYGQTNYEPSPLARVNGVTAPGDNWTGSDRGSQALNTTNTLDDQVIVWNVINAGSPGVFGTYTYSTVYPAGMLSKVIALEENGKQVINFKDLNGNLILEKHQLTGSPDDGTGTGYNGWLCTYYLYDNWNNLRCVIQPTGVQQLLANGWNLSALGGSILSQQCFRYEYDARNRVIEKQIPGKQPEYFVHDNLDRIIMTQDGNLRAASQWLVTMYESALDRPVGTGIWTNSALTFSGLLSAAYYSTSYPFTLTTMPGSSWELLTEIGYDNYTGIPSGVGGNFNSGYTASNFYSTYNASPTYAQSMTQATSSTTITTQGLMTWTKAEVLGTNDAQFIEVSKIYDTRARVIQEQTLNYTGGVDISTTQYNFIGLPLIHDLLHHLGSTQTYEVGTRNSYDNLERLTEVDKIVISPVTSSQWKTTSLIYYDAIGRLVTKKIGNNPVQSGQPLETQAFEYNVRGWTLGVNRAAINSTATTPFFGYELGYDKTATIIGGTTSYPNSQYNGNIAGTIWKNAGDQQVKKYDFTYDADNRLTLANFNEYTGGTFNTSAGLNFSVSVPQYDPNGNIMQMNVTGWKNGTSSTIDNLTYNYTPYPGSTTQFSSQLLNVQNPSSDQNTTLEDFHYSPTYTSALGSGGKPITATDYAYDNNGNLTSDKNKDITGIAYNYLNIPRMYTIAGSTSNGTITFVYDATGNKLYKQVVETGATVNGQSTTITTTTTYVDGFVYKSLNYSNSALSSLNYSNNLQFFGHEEGRGRAQYNNASSPNMLTGLVFDYFLQDQLGNTRAVVTEEQETDTYPTLSFEGSNSAAVANQNAVWDNDLGESINVLSNRTSALPTAFAASPSTYGTYCGSVTHSTGPIGAAKLLRVMAGDQLSASVVATYSSATVDNSSASGLNTLVNSIAAMILGSNVNSVLDGSTMANALQTSQGTSSTVSNFFTNTWKETPGANTTPEAYLHVLLFNDQFVFDNVNSQVYPLSGSALNAAQTLQTPGPIQITKDGYAYIYFSNESNTVVYFDNFNLNDIRGPIVETNDYYPFGLTMAATSGMAMKTPYAPNKFRYNGKELQNQEFSNGSGLEEYDYGARYQDPQLGRWWVVDPEADQAKNYSPYNYALNNPVNMIDPDGQMTIQADDPMEKNALRLILESTHDRIKGLKEGSAELKALEDLSGMKTKKDLLNFYTENGSGPILTTKSLTFGDEGRGLDDGNGGSADLGQMIPDKNPDQSQIVIDKGVVDAVADGIQSQDILGSYGSFGVVPDGFAPPDVNQTMTKTVNFAVRVMEHETTHWGAQYVLNLDEPKGYMNVSIPGIGLTLALERGKLFEWDAFKTKGNPFNPDESSWAIAEIYTHIQYTKTNDRSTLGPTGSINQRNADLVPLATKFKLQKRED